MHRPFLLAETPQSRRQQKTRARASLPRPRRQAMVLKFGIKPKSKDVSGSLQMDAGERFKQPEIERETEPHQTSARIMAASFRKFFTMAFACGVVAANGPAIADGCAFQPQGEGRVAVILDARSFRLEDGREVVLAGIEPGQTEKSKDISALAAIVAGREVTLSGQDDTPDRYGREPAFVFLASSQTPVQAQLLAQGAALVSGSLADKACASVLAAAETAAREAKLGVWADQSAIKNTESPGDILAGIGRFMVVEGKVLSVRQAGATTYLNFGRNWTRDFAVTISKRMLPAFEAAGIVLKSLENKRIRVRGWVETRGGPRIEALHVGQIEVLGGN